MLADLIGQERVNCFKDFQVSKISPNTGGLLYTSCVMLFETNVRLSNSVLFVAKESSVLIRKTENVVYRANHNDTWPTL